MKSTVDQRTETRRAILEALAEIVVKQGGLDFSIQQVADRAGVTHRTVYNHFPTREALREGLADHVEARLAELNPGPRPDDGEITIDRLPSMAAQAYAAFETDPAHLRANVILMLASRGLAQVTKNRTAVLQKVIAAHEPLQTPIPSHAVVAAVRMFLSVTGWHLLTELYGLTPKEASDTAVWATQTLLDSATGRRRRSRKK